MNRFSKTLIALFMALGLFIGFNACRDNYIDLAALQQEEVENREHYLADNYNTVEVMDTVNEKMVTALVMNFGNGDTIIAPTSSGLYFIQDPDSVGEGIKPTLGRLITVEYTGTLLDGTEFDSDDWFVHQHGSATAGWTEGLSMMKKGGRATLIVPSELAYGQFQQGEIPRYSTLIFDVKLHNAQK